VEDNTMSEQQVLFVEIKCHRQLFIEIQTLKPSVLHPTNNEKFAR
jgi:hypothetical protein